MMVASKLQVLCLTCLGGCAGFLMMVGFLWAVAWATAPSTWSDYDEEDYYEEEAYEDSWYYGEDINTAAFQVASGHFNGRSFRDKRAGPTEMLVTL